MNGVPVASDGQGLITVHIPSGSARSRLKYLFDSGFLTVKREVTAPAPRVPGPHSNINVLVTDVHEPRAMNHLQEPRAMNDLQDLVMGNALLENPEVINGLPEPLRPEPFHLKPEPIIVTPPPDRVRNEKPEVLDLLLLPPPSDLRRELICYVCEGLPQSPLFFCTGGHHLCFPCGEGLPACPVSNPEDTRITCGKALAKTTSFFFSTLFSESTFHCPYASSGCTKKLFGSVLELHRSNCPFRPYVACPVTKCSVKIMSSVEYKAHIVDFHKVIVISESAYTLQLPYDAIQADGSAHNCFVAAIMEERGLDFAFCIEEDPLNYTMWMASMNNPEIVGLRTFKCAFRLTSETNNYMLQWQGEVHPRERTLDSILSEGECLTVARTLLSKKYVFRDDADGGSFWNVQISVAEVKAGLALGWNGWSNSRPLTPEFLDQVVSPIVTSPSEDAAEDAAGVGAGGAGVAGGGGGDAAGADGNSSLSLAETHIQDFVSKWRDSTAAVAGTTSSVGNHDRTESLL